MATRDGHPERDAAPRHYVAAVRGELILRRSEGEADAPPPGWPRLRVPRDEDKDPFPIVAAFLRP
ncbi:MAG: hypothetical protein ACYTKD_13415 [Planctomycetota bacterium]|jgi:hypothetical protein